MKKLNSYPFVYILIFLAGGIFLYGCEREKDNYLSIKNNDYGYIPIYDDTFPNLTDRINSIASKPIKNNGSMVTHDKYLFISELEEGIHVFDNSNPSSPMPVCFLEVPGALGFSCKDSTLFAESKYGIVHFNISGLPQIRDIVFMDSIYSKFTTGEYYFPEFNSDGEYFILKGEGNVPYTPKTFFECTDPNKGYIIGWKYGKIGKPACFIENDYYSHYY